MFASSFDANVLSRGGDVYVITPRRLKNRPPYRQSINRPNESFRILL